MSLCQTFCLSFIKEGYSKGRKQRGKKVTWRDSDSFTAWQAFRQRQKLMDLISSKIYICLNPSTLDVFSLTQTLEFCSDGTTQCVEHKHRAVLPARLDITAARWVDADIDLHSRSKDGECSSAWNKITTLTGARQAGREKIPLSRVPHCHLGLPTLSLWIKGQKVARSSSAGMVLCKCNSIKFYL